MVHVRVDRDVDGNRVEVGILVAFEEGMGDGHGEGPLVDGTQEVDGVVPRADPRVVVEELHCLRALEVHW